MYGNIKLCPKGHIQQQIDQFSRGEEKFEKFGNTYTLSTVVNCLEFQ